MDVNLCNVSSIRFRYCCMLHSKCFQSLAIVRAEHFRSEKAFATVPPTKSSLSNLTKENRTLGRKRGEKVASLFPIHHHGILDTGNPNFLEQLCNMISDLKNLCRRIKKMKGKKRRALKINKTIMKI